MVTLRDHTELQAVSGELDTVPMGYLFCGPVGTGKSFLATCVAGSIRTGTSLRRASTMSKIMV